MAYAIQAQNLSLFCRDRGLMLSFIGESARPQGLRIQQDGIDREVRYAKSTAQEVERWASTASRKNIAWDLTPLEGGDGSWELKTEFENALSKKPSDCLSEPGSAYRIKAEETGDKPGTMVPLLPERSADGSYAYEVLTSEIMDIDAWKRAVAAAGFAIRNSKDGKSFYGSRFPGGYLEIAPPLSLVKWIRTDETKPSARGPAKKIVGSGKAEGMAGAPAQATSPGLKTWVKLPGPDFASCQSLYETFRVGNDTEARIVLQSPPAGITRAARKADFRENAKHLEVLRAFVMNWAPRAGSRCATLPALMRKMRTVATGEASYCLLFTELDKNFEVNWASKTCDYEVAVRAPSSEESSSD